MHKLYRTDNFTNRDVFTKLVLFCRVSQYLGDIEEHLGVTIDQVDTSLKIVASEFDGKVTYGQKRSAAGKQKQNIGFRLFLIFFQLELSNNYLADELNVTYIFTVFSTITLQVKEFVTFWIF